MAQSAIEDKDFQALYYITYKKWLHGNQPVKEYKEKLLDAGTKVRYLYEPGELEGYQYKGERRKRSTDPIWLVDMYKIKDRYVQKHQPTLYYLDSGPKRSFVFEELQPIHDP